jgi:hypothetical protein
LVRISRTLCLPASHSELHESMVSHRTHFSKALEDSR